MPGVDDKPLEDFKKTIYSEKPDRTYVKGTIIKHPDGTYDGTGTFKTSGGQFKDWNSLSPEERQEIINEFENERTNWAKEYQNVPPSLGQQPCDNDADGDGVPNSSDNCPQYGQSNSNQSDVDCDGVGDICDNCPSIYNPTQADCNANGIGDACEGGSTTSTQYAQTLTLPIPDNNSAGVSTTIHVPDSGTIADLRVDLGIAHGRQSDLVVTLKHGTQTINLINRPGTAQPLAGCGAGATGYTAADFGTPGLPLQLNGCAPLPIDCYDGTGTGQAGYVGPAHASRLLEAFAGANKQGDWQLTVSDQAAGNTGTLNEWRLTFQTLATTIPKILFGQTVFATSKTTLGWSSPADIDLIRGDLTGVASYVVIGRSSLFAVNSISIGGDNPPPGGGFYYVVRRGGTCGSWQSSLGLETDRDVVIP